MTVVFWLILLIIMILIEIITVGLTTIWFAGGAVAALLAYAIGLSQVWQVVIFLVVPLLLLFFTRPFAIKYINTNQVKTNYESLIGKKVRITETVDNLKETGTVVINGVEWTVRTQKEGVILPPGSIARIIQVEGVKLIVEENKED